MVHRTVKHTHASQTNPQTRGRTIRWANRYDTTVRLMTLGQDKALREMTADLARIQPGDKVLDVGCGTGDLTIAAKKRAGSTGTVCGIDASTEMIEVARAKVANAGIPIEFRVEPIEALSFADNTFDVVVSSLMMHHLPDDLKRDGLAEIYRVLKPGGHLLVVDMKRPTAIASRLLMTLLMHHGRMDTGVQDLPAILKAVGFTRIETGNTRFLPLGFVRAEVGA